MPRSAQDWVDEQQNHEFSLCVKSSSSMQQNGEIDPPSQQKLPFFLLGTGEVTPRTSGTQSSIWWWKTLMRKEGSIIYAPEMVLI